MIKTENFQKVQVTSQSELRSWLMQNHVQEESVWLVTFKKTIEQKYVSTSEVLDELLCFGWVDGIRRKLDSERTMQLISPRRQKHWSKTYKERALSLIEKGLIQPAGLLSIEQSKSNGLWDFMDDVDAMILPEDLKRKLSKNEDALSFFEAINPSSLRFALRWLKLAKTSETRMKRINHLFEISKKGEKLKGS